MRASPGDLEICPSALNGEFSIPITLVPNNVIINLSDKVTASVTVFVHFAYRKFLCICQIYKYWFTVHLLDVIIEQIDLICTNVINLYALQAILFSNS